MLTTTAGIMVLFLGVALLAMSVLMWRATSRHQQYTRAVRYSRSMNPAIRERGPYVMHGMVDGPDHALVPQKRKTASWYDSFS